VPACRSAQRRVGCVSPALIRTAVNRNQPTGYYRFVDETARRVERRIEFRGQGRPRKSGK